MTTFYCIDDFDINHCYDTLEQVALELQSYDPEYWVHVYGYFTSGPDGIDKTTEIVYRGYAGKFVTPLEQHIMDAATANLGNRLNG